MTQQQYTPVSWQDETTSQQGTLINAERLNQMQTAHHYADGLEEVDTVPTADPGVAYHKIVYCTADSTIYRWDGTQWTADIDDPTRELLEEHLADHGNPHQVTKSQVGLGNADNTSDMDKPISTATQTALDTKLTQRYTTAVGREYVYAYTRTQQTAIEASSGMETLTIPIRDSEGAMHAQVPASPQATHVINYGWANTELDKKADKATTYTKSETDTLLGGKADKATTLAGYGITDAYTKTEADTLLGAKANDNAVVHLAGAETISGAKTFTEKLTLQSNAPYLQMKSTQAVGTNQYLGFIQELDANGTEIFDIYPMTDAQGGVSVNIAVKGNGPVRVPSPGSRAPSNAVATIATLDGYLPMVRTTGNQEIAGVKTYTGQIRISKNDDNIALANPNITVGTLPASRSSSSVIFTDKNFTQIGYITNQTYTDGTGRFRIATYNYTKGASAILDVFCQTDGTGYVTAPTRGYNAGSTYSNDVATIGTLDAYTPMVRTTGNQEIAGIKNFQDGVMLKKMNTSREAIPTGYHNQEITHINDANNVYLAQLVLTSNTSAQDPTKRTMYLQIRFYGKNGDTSPLITIAQGDVPGE